MKKAIYYRLITIVLISITIFGAISSVVTNINDQEQIRGWLANLTFTLTELYDYNNDVDFLSITSGGHRITIIDPNGYIIADSHVLDLAENRSDREEFLSATTGSIFTLIRTSNTLGEQFMYATTIVNDGNVLRIAYSYPGLIHNFFVHLPALLTAMIIALLLSIILANKFTKTVTTPLEDMIKHLEDKNYEHLHNHESPYSEVNFIMKNIKRLLQQLSDSKQSLQLERDRINHVLSNMAEGFVLIDESETILLCNNSAKRFFNNVDEVINVPLLNLVNDKTISIAATKALEKQQSSMFDLHISDELILNVYVSPTQQNTHSDDSARGVTLLFVDTTVQKQLEQQKRDFFSNASHELKTPITSILGFSEMLTQNIIKTDEERSSVINRIEVEAKRMSELVNNLLTVSKLESSPMLIEHIDFNLKDVVEEAIASVSPVMNNNERVDVKLQAQNVIVHGNKQQLYEMCVNLIENAVKYNKPGGEVVVTLLTRGHNVNLKVKDSGIGIEPVHQARIFERFFRIDYGRDKKVGGSGLGLSIVKHIVSLYNGKISLRSKKDIGTTIQISLPIVVRL